MFQGDFLKQGTGLDRGHSEQKLQEDDLLLSYMSRKVESRNILKGPN